MHVNSEGIIVRQIRTAGGRKMLLLFTAKYGKISVGTNLDGKGKSKSSLALRPFTYGDYQIFQGRNYYNLDRAETIRSFYALGEDLDKYMAASYVMELTEKVIPEDVPQPAVFNMLIEFLSELSERKSRHQTLVLAYEIKLLRLLGMMPVTASCVRCGARGHLTDFNVSEGGMMCGKCAEKVHSNPQDSLIYTVKFDIVEVINYFADHPFAAFRKIALSEERARELQSILRDYFSYHLDVGDLKSEKVFSGS